MAIFPVIDISYIVDNHGIDRNDMQVQSICKEITNAFREWGFFYMKGHGIPHEFIQQIFQVSREFFTLPVDEKRKVLKERLSIDSFTGYIPFTMVTFDHRKPFDLKEAFDYTPASSDEIKRKVPSNLLEIFAEMFQKFHFLSFLILDLINLIIGLDDSNFLTKAHDKLGKKGNATIIRSLHYPCVDRKEFEKDQHRCDEHTDFGTLTLLFQDEAGGLQVESPLGEFIEAVPIEGTIIVNAGDLLQRWTSDMIKATKHRVVLPQDTTKPRQSIAFFLQPDDDVLVTCLDGSDKYEPVTSYDYIDGRVKAVFSNIKS